MRVKPYLIVRTFKRCYSVSSTARLLGISRLTVYRWLKRARSPLKQIQYSERNLRRKSTCPHRIHRLLSPQEESAIITLREEKGYTAEKIKYVLKLSVSRNTIHRLLVCKQLINHYGNHIRPRYQKTTHMHLRNTTTIGKLQMDVKYITPELSGLPYTCFEYAVVDIFSRYKEAVILNHLDQDGSILALMDILKRLPFTPDFIQTDNGLEFQGRFHQYCQQRGLTHHLIHKSTPNENAVIERTFRTDEEEFFFRMKRAPLHYDELREWFIVYLHEYNYIRPHLGINLKTPYEVVTYVLGD
ncbi:MAG: integrase core domain-containing protein [Nitrososphaeraceae archaeon]